MKRKTIGLIILGVLLLIFIGSYFHRRVQFSKTCRSSVAQTMISEVSIDSTLVRWILTGSDFTSQRKPILSRQRRRRDPFQPPFTKSTKSVSNLQTIRLRLEGIVARGGTRKAIISGKTYSLGDWILGKKIVEIGSDYVVLQSSNSKRILSLFN